MAIKFAIFINQSEQCLVQTLYNFYSVLVILFGLINIFFIII